MEEIRMLSFFLHHTLITSERNTGKKPAIESTSILTNGDGFPFFLPPTVGLQIGRRRWEIGGGNVL